MIVTATTASHVDWIWIMTQNIKYSSESRCPAAWTQEVRVMDGWMDGSLCHIRESGKKQKLKLQVNQTFLHWLSHFFRNETMIKRSWRIKTNMKYMRPGRCCALPELWEPERRCWRHEWHGAASRCLSSLTCRRMSSRNARSLMEWKRSYWRRDCGTRWQTRLYWQSSLTMWNTLSTRRRRSRFFCLQKLNKTPMISLKVPGYWLLGICYSWWHFNRL